MKLIRTLLAVAALASFAVPALAAPEKFNIDNTHSQAGFAVRHFFSKTPGRFNQLSGTIMFDSKNLTASSVDVTIPVSGINTQNEKRDGHLKSADFFDAEKFPEITFKSTKVIPGKDNKFQIEGDLTMKGVTKKVVLDAELVGMGAIAMGGNAMGTRAGFEATTTVNRQDYGINWNKTMDQGGAMLGDDVAITLQVEAIKDEPKAAAPAAAATKK